MGNCEQIASIVIFLDSLILDQGTTPEEEKAVASVVVSLCLNAPKLVLRNQTFFLNQI